MTTGADIARSALAYQGTPFVHQGRMRDVGIDCAGLVICIAHEHGLFDFDTTNYGRQPDPARFVSLLHAHLNPAKVIEAGVVLSFAFVRHQMHLGIAVSSGSFVHAYEGHGVIVSTLNAQWFARLRSRWQYRGVVYHG
jgi:cell wall-associated NlpC family hydrolase